MLSWHEGSSSIKYLSKIRVLLLIKALFYKHSSYACLRILFSCPCLKSKETIIVLLAAIWLLGDSNPASELGFEHLDSSCVYAGMQTPGQPEPTAAEGSRTLGAAEKEISRLLWEYSCISGPVLQLQWDSWIAATFTGWGYDIPFAIQDRHVFYGSRSTWLCCTQSSERLAKPATVTVTQILLAQCNYVIEIASCFWILSTCEIFTQRTSLM